MSDHAWTLEHLETYAADGLDPAERERLEQHVAACPACAQALDEVRTLDRSLGGLFADERPAPALEDRLIRSLRIGAAKKKSRLPMAIRIAVASAAVLLVGIVGAAASQFVMDGELPLPGVAQSPVSEMLDRHWTSVFEPQDEAQLKRDPEAIARNLASARQRALRDRDPNGLAQVEELVEASRRVATEGLGKEFNLQNEDAGLDRSKMLAYNVDRIEKERVPGPDDLTRNYNVHGNVRTERGDSNAAPAEIPPPLGFGRGQGGASANGRHEWGYRQYIAGGEGRKSSVEDQTGRRQTAQDSSRMPPGTPPPDEKPASVGGGSVAAVIIDGEKLNKATFKEADAYYLFTDKRPTAPASSSTPAMTPSAPPAAEPVPVPQRPGLGDGRPAAREPDRAQPGQPGTSGGDRNGSGRGPGDGYFKPADAAKGEGGSGDAGGEGGQRKPAEAGDPQAPKPDRTGGTTGTPGDPKKGIVEGEIRGQGQGGPGQGGGNNQEKPPPVPKKIIIRSGEIEFEIDSFDSAVATATKLVNAIPNGFVATVNSEKLPNGKVRGSVVVRVPPEALDGLVLDLRKELGKTGELKGQRIGSQDITKQYTDLESRLRAAKAMETRLLEIIKTGKGEIKDLLQAEKELGVWRTKIEEIEGELRYYSNLVSLSTLTITLYEKEIRTAAAVIETERVNMGVEVEDVIKALRETQKAITEAKGRITKSEMKQHAAGQLQAVVNFEVAPEAAGTLQDRLRQLGTVTRLEIDRVSRTEGGTGRPEDSKTKRAETQFFVSLYNVANIAPRETMQVQLAAKDAEAAYKAILARVEQAGGRVVTSNLNRQRSEQTTGTIHFEVKSGEAEAVLLDLRNEGEVLHLQSTESADTQNVTRAKRGFQVTILSLYNPSAVAPHTTVHLNLAAADAEEAYRAVLARVEKAGGRVVSSNLNRQRNDQTQGTVHFEVQSAEADAVLADLRGLGEVQRLQSSENPGGQVTARTKRAFQVQVLALGAVQPRETVNVQVATRDVPASYRAVQEAVSKAKGRMLDARLNEQDKQNITATLDFDVRRSEEAAIEAALAKAGTGIARNVSRAQDSENVIDTKVRFQVMLSDVSRIPPRETVTLAVETQTVERDLAALTGLLGQAQGRTVRSIVTHEPSGKVVANVIVDVPLAQKNDLVEKVRSFGTVRVHNSTRHTEVPEHPLSVARLEVVLQGTPPIVAKDDGIWPQVRKGLTTSVQWIGVSLMWAVVGVSVILPWALIVYGIVRLVMRWTRREEAAVAVTTAP